MDATLLFVLLAVFLAAALLAYALWTDPGRFI